MITRRFFIILGGTVVITPEAKNRVADLGFDSQYGARPLKRAIQNYIEDPLSEILLREEAVPGDSIVIDLVNDEIVARVEKATTITEK